MKKFFLIFILLSQLIFSTVSPWPLIYFDPQNTSKSENVGPASISLLWSSKEFSKSSIFLNENEIITIGNNEVAKINSATGNLVWKKNIDDGSPSIPGIGANSFIYFYTLKKLYCLEPNNGELIWEKEFQEILNSHLVVDSLNRLYIKNYLKNENKSEIIAIDGGSGNILWSYKYDDFGLSKISTIIDENGFCYFIDNFLISIDGSGKKLWKILPSEIGESFIEKPFILFNGIIFCFTSSGSNYFNFYGIKRENGEVIFKVPLSFPYFRTSPQENSYPVGCVGSNNYLYFALGKIVFCYDLNGNLIKYKEVSCQEPSSIVSSKNSFLYISSADKIIILDNDLNFVSEYKLPKNISFSMLSISSDEKLYLASDSFLYSFSQGNFFFSNLFLIPVSANSEGAGGTLWMTDLFLFNNSYEKTDVLIALLESSKDNRNFENIYINLNPLESISFKDILKNYFNYTGTGSLLIQSSKSDIIINSRTYNKKGNGSYGQYIPSIYYENLLGDYENGAVAPLIENNDFRTNIGFSNLTELPLEIEIKFYDNNGYEIGKKDIALLPLSHIQINQVLKNFCNGECENFKAKFKSKSEGAKFYGYASIVDNKTGDGIFIPAIKAIF